MLKSKTRRRVMAKTAAIGAVGAGLFFGAVPALASMVAAPKPVTYECQIGAAGGPTATMKFQMDLTGPIDPTPSSTIVATWKIGQPAASPSLTAPSAFPTPGRLLVEADVAISASPMIVPSELRSVAASGAPATMSQGAMLQPPNLLITMTPTAPGVIAVQPDGFSLYMAPTNTADPEATLYDCTVDPAATAEAAAAALRITVKPSTAATGTTTPTTTPTSPTSTPTTATPSVKPTITVFETVTASPTRSRTGQIGRTPGGGAATGGGGDAGPDARVIMLAGALMVGGAAIGGLALRRRTAARG
ncbi:hypothetical protein GCM10010156_71080 [Planobispora rosea]|uniref:Gram-positive cocci surface proteins LPxTG domain-containing protein n=1 Tax=Planobispora rosea TaxID=35762 RepID=A0A8J3S1L5_PLARO|nr:hypothetical protein [Planobispora rosea]GGT02915.1 hypothetical protein GCM10010156_71080 [Planobispora rosea]GIH86846.1 hypothetical protein Pro02_52540 [Planobispora rosea]